MTKSQIYWPHSEVGQVTERGRFSLPGTFRAKRGIFMPKPSDDQIQMISFKQTDGLPSNGMPTNEVKPVENGEEIIDVYDNKVSFMKKTQNIMP